MTSGIAVEITGLSKKYGHTIALNSLNLTVPEGSVFGLVGRNGAGKTTALSIMAGLVKADSGQINIFGNGSFHPVTHKGEVTLLPQDAQLPGHATVSDLLGYLAQLQGIPSSAVNSAVDKVLGWVDLSDRAKHRVQTLSHGMLRRLTVAQAFLGSPRLVMLDEPASGLDPEQVVQIRNLIQSRHHKQTIIISSHILSEIEAVCDAVAFIEKGETVRQDSIEEITGRNRVISYTLSPGLSCMDTLRNTLPDVEFVSSSNKERLSVSFNARTLTHAEVNRKVLGIILQTNTDILEIRSGTSLENEFLEQF
jgi:ABC-2 type transport system ATP-binding protein